MLRILKRFFDFCGAENKKKFYKALFLGVVFALLEAVKIPAILLLIDGAIKQNVTESLIVLCLGMLVASLAAASVVKYQITMLQCEAGYYTACGKRIEIAELPIWMELFGVFLLRICLKELYFVGNMGELPENV